MDEPTRKPADELDSLPEQVTEELEATDVKGGFDPQPDPPDQLLTRFTRPDPPPLFKKQGL
jgi:hypothetical protein